MKYFFFVKRIKILSIMSISIKCFHVEQTDKFKVSSAVDSDNLLLRNKTNWSQHENLTNTLIDEVTNEIRDLNLINIGCEDDQLIGINHDNDEAFDYNVDSEQKRKICHKIKTAFKDYYEVYSRDQDALCQEDFDVKIYAIVLLLDDKYQGHIYAWISPKDKNYCFTMGIRNKVESIIYRVKGSGLSNVSGYLLEGVRQFALAQGANKLYVVYPRQIMTTILPKLGFKQSTLNANIIGTSIQPFSFICNSCYEYIDINTNIISNDINFNVY